MKAVVAGLCMLASASAYAGGFSVAAVPTKVDIIRGEGIVIAGEFGNPGGCSNANFLFVRSDHPDYKQIYAAALAALVSKQKIYGYVHYCVPVLWYSVPTSTYNAIDANGSLAITN